MRKITAKAFPNMHIIKVRYFKYDYYQNRNSIKSNILRAKQRVLIPPSGELRKYTHTDRDSKPSPFLKGKKNTNKVGHRAIVTTSNIMLDGSSPMDDEEEKIVPPRTKGIQRSSMVFVLLIYSVYESLELDDEKKNHEGIKASQRYAFVLFNLFNISLKINEFSETIESMVKKDDQADP